MLVCDRNDTRQWFRLSVGAVADYIENLNEEDKELFFKVNMKDFFNSTDFWRIRLIAMASQYAELCYEYDSIGFDAYDLLFFFDIKVEEIADLCNTVVAIKVSHPRTNLVVRVYFKYLKCDDDYYITGDVSVEY